MDNNNNIQESINKESINKESSVQERFIHDQNELRNLANLINSLPDDVMRHIYEEYFVGIDTCNKFLELLKSKESQSLQYEHLTEATQMLLKHPCAVEYLCKKHSIFKKMYTEHYIQNNKMFLQMDMLRSFIVSILMHLYH